MKVNLIILTLLVIGLFSIWYLTPKKYTETVDGVYYQLGKEGVIEHIKMRFDGKLKYHINGKKSFRGKVDMEGTEVPHIPKDRTELELHYNGDNFSTLFSAFRIKDDRGRLEGGIFTYGWIYINDDFTEFTIKVLADDESSTRSLSDGFMITAPAKDREEAMNKSERLIKKFESE